MLEYSTTQSSWSGVLDGFRDRTGNGHDRHVHDIAYHLLRLILARRDFDDIKALIEFCEDPENFETWLPSESDRVIFSAGIVERLQELSSTPV